MIATTALALLLACGAPETPREGEEAWSQMEIGGHYHVTGVTIDHASATHRPVRGRVSLTLDGDRYTTHFELNTVYPGSDSVAAEIVGTGEGTVEGPKLSGSAELQVIAATVPGVDVDFAFIPRSVSSRVVSTSEAEFFPDGSVRIDIENQPAEGEDYRPTTTQLVGYRLEDI